MKQTIYAALMLLLSASCTDTEEPGIPELGRPASIRVSVVTTDGIDTRGVLTGNSLKEGDQIGLTLCDESQTLYHGTEYENICYTAIGDGAGQTWEGETSIMVSNTSGTLYGYYPYSSEVEDIQEIAVSLESQTDYLYAIPVPDITKSNNEARLVMKHALAALRLSVSRGTYSGNGIISAASVCGEDIPSSALLNARTGELSGFKDYGKMVSTTVSEVALDQDNRNIDLLVIPEGEGSHDVEVRLTIDGKQYTATIPDIPIKQGMMSECSITVNNGLVSVTDVNVIAWSQTTAGSQIVQNDFKVSIAGDTEGLAFSNSIDEEGGITILAIPYISEYAETRPITIDGEAELTQSVEEETGILTVRLTDIRSDITVNFDGFYSWYTFTHDITDISQPTLLYNVAAPVRMKIDGMEVSPAKTYQFETTGEHIVKMALDFYTSTPVSFCMNIRTITSAIIPEGVEEMWSGAFSGCTKLKDISLPSTLSLINYQCFSSTAIESISIPDGCMIGYGLFSGCSSLKSVRLPADLTEIPELLFKGCRALTEVELPKGITKIEQSVFKGSGIISFHFPEMITEIPSGTFDHCESLKEVKFPKHFTKIGDRAFWGCKSLERTITSEGTVYEGEFHIPEGVTSIDYLSMMFDSDLIKTIHIPSTLVTLQSAALSSSMIERYTMTLPNPNYDIRNNSVVETATNTLIAGGTESTKIHESVTSIGESAFYWSKINAIDIHEGITSIGDKAFHYAHPILVISRSVTPPALGSESFWISKYDGILKVPEEAIEAYRSEWMIDQLGYLGYASMRWTVQALAEGE